MKVEKLTAAGVHKLLEGPHWDIERQSLYFNDILECKIFRYDYREGKVYEAQLIGEEVQETPYIGFIVPIDGKSDEFIVAYGRRLVVVKWDGISPAAHIQHTYAEVDQHVGTTRINDGKVDPQGRIFAGTMRAEHHGPIDVTRFGTFYQFIDGTARVLREKIMVSNGMTWNETTNKFYYVDSGDLKLLEYDYDPKTGGITNEQVVLEIPIGTYFLDGLTIDASGLIYIATFLGGRVIVVDPSQRKIVREIEIPEALQITSVAFGGPNLDELFVTTAATDGHPGANGGIHKVTGLGVKGTRMYAAKI